MAVAIAALSAPAFGYVTRAGGAAAAADIRGLAEVAAPDLPAALDTIDGSPQAMAELKGREACNNRLAWVAVARSPGQPAGRIRLQSGDYLSPVFELADTPVRVALPYPVPYPIGRGTISVVGATSDAIVALSPPWHVPAQGGAHVQAVTWTPVACPAAER